MSRKTRKLIWSAPLVAVLAVAGALAIFAALGPNQAQATHETLPGAPTNLSVVPAEGNAGRTSLVLTWDAPENSTVTGYRIDYSRDNVEYMELVPNSESTATTYPHTGLDSGQTYIYRVFAINSAGTGLVSETYSNTTKGAAGTPDDVIGLTAVRAATTPEKWSQIDLSWTEPYGGGLKISGYCIEVGGGDEVAAPWPVAGAGCRATPPSPATFAPGTPGTAGSGTIGVIVTGNTMTKYSHKMLPAGARRYYRVFALTGPAATPAASEMPSNEASAITAPRENPLPPGTVRAAKSADGATVNLYWYWPAHNGGMAVTNFRVEVTTNPNDWPDPADTTANTFAGADVRNAVGATPAVHSNGVLAQAVAGAQSNSASAQTSHGHLVDSSATNKKLYYRVFTETGTGDSLLRSSYSNTASVIVNGGSNPAIPVFEAAGAAPADGNDGRTEIDLMWGPNVTWDDPNDSPDAGATLTYRASGYRLDYALGKAALPADDVLEWKPLWGNTGFTATKFTHKPLKPSTRVYYRVFAIGPAQTISTAANPQSATTKAAGALGKVRNVRAVADNPTQITVTWDAPADTMPSDIDQYNVQMKMLGATDPTVFDPDATGGPKATKSGMVTTYVHEDLTESQGWLYRVAAVSAGRSTTTDPHPSADEYTEWKLATTPEAGKPDMPIGLVAEDARDSNLTAPGARGVLLIWNMPEGPDGSVINRYKIERKVMGTDTDFKALGTSDGSRTTYTDSKEPAEGEIRYYRVAAVSKTTLTGEWATVRFPIDLTHNYDPVANDMAIDPVTVRAGAMSDPIDVSMYFSDADMDDLTYRAESSDATIADATVSGSMVTIEGMMEGMATITVYASDGMGGTDAMRTIDVTVTAASTELTAPSGIMTTVSDDDPGEQDVTIRWTDGANAQSHTVILFDYPSFEVDTGHIATLQDSGDTTFHDVEVGQYVVVVVAIGSDGRYKYDHETVSVGQ